MSGGVELQSSDAILRVSISVEYFEKLILDAKFKMVEAYPSKDVTDVFAGTTRLRTPKVVFYRHRPGLVRASEYPR